jgi:hypothetical protein
MDVQLTCLFLGIVGLACRLAAVASVEKCLPTEHGIVECQTRRPFDYHSYPTSWRGLTTLRKRFSG